MYNKVLENCINSCNAYLKSPGRERKYSQTKGNFLFQLECLNTTVQKWNETYPGIEPKLKKTMVKKMIIQNIKNLINNEKNTSKIKKKKIIFKNFYLWLKIKVKIFLMIKLL